MDIELSEVKRPKSQVSFFCLLFSVFCLLQFASGCEDTSGNKPSLAEQVSLLKQEKTQLAHQVEQSETENKQLKKRIHVLSGLGQNIMPGDIYRLQRVKLTRYTNIYDKNKDGKAESLIVYIQPMDADGDIIKVTTATRWRSPPESCPGRW